MWLESNHRKGEQSAEHYGPEAKLSINSGTLMNLGILQSDFCNYL